VIGITAIREKRGIQRDRAQIRVSGKRVQSTKKISLKMRGVMVIREKRGI
jgi:hypothetical protein